MVLDEDRGLIEDSDGLSALFRTNLLGMDVGLAFLISWTSSMCPTLMGERGIGAMAMEFLS